MPVRPKILTRNVTTPDTGIQVTLKDRLTYGDNKANYLIVFGDVQYDGEGDHKTKVTLAQSQQLVSLTLEKAIVDWDVTEDDGSKIEPTVANIDEIFTDADINFLMAQVQRPEVEKKNQSADS